MAVPTTLHIGRPCMRCKPSRTAGLGGVGLSPCRGLGGEGVGGGGRATLAGGGGGRRTPSARPRPATNRGGLWGCVETAAPGGGSVSSPAALHCSPGRGGGGGAREGRGGEGLGGLGGRATQ